MANKRKKLSKRQKAQLVTGYAKKPVLSFRYIITSLLLVVAASYGLHYIVVNRIYQKVTAPALQKTNVCTVTATDYTDIFDTSCGKLIWGVNLDGTPSSELTVGSRYQFTYNGGRIDWMQVEPKVSSFSPAP